MKPSPVINYVINVYRQESIKISACIFATCEGSPAGHVDGMCEAGNYKSSVLGG
jgi:hypothetical protein